MDEQVIKLGFQADTSGATRMAGAAQSVAAAVRSVTTSADGLERQWVKASSGTEAYARSLGKASKGAGDFTYRLGVMAATADDLQYVGEMGLRPILNNLTMIHPALGIVAIGFETVRKNAAGLKTAGDALMQADPLKGMLESSDSLSIGLKGIIGYLKDVTAGALQAAGGFGQMVTEFFQGSKADQGAAAAASFRGGLSNDQKAKGASIKSLVDERGPGAVLDELLGDTAKWNPAVAKPGAARNAESGRIVDLLTKAQQGDPSAVGEIERQFGGTGFGKAVAANDPAAVARRKAQEKEIGEQDKIAEEIAQANNDAVDRKIQGIARDLQDRYTQEKAGGKDHHVGDVVGELRKTLPERQAQAFARNVFDILEENAAKAIEENARRKGISLDASKADLAGANNAPLAMMGPGRPEAAAVNQADAARRAGRATGLQAKIAEASGLQDPATQFLMDARQRPFMDLNFQRRFSRMGFEQQQATIGKINDKADAQAEGEIYKRLRRQGIGEENARATAKGMVAEARKRANGETGDLETEAAEKNTEATERLTAAIEKLGRNGLAARVY